MISNERTEILILKSLCQSSDFLSKAFPYIKREYFQDYHERLVFEAIAELVTKYNCNPSTEMLLIHFYEKEALEDEQYKSIKSIVELLSDKVSNNQAWLMETSENWCKNQAFIHAVTKAAEIATGDSKNLIKTDVPELFKEALSVSFDQRIGHSYMEDSGERFALYGSEQDKFPCDIDIINKATHGGFFRKTLNVFMGTPGAGKSLVLCSLAAGFLSKGRNVVYITLELSESNVAKRIDSNLFNITMHDLDTSKKDDLKSKLERIKRTVIGNLYIKEYPTSTANVNHFKQYLKELELKKNFKTDIIMIDYLNISRSTRMKSSSDQYAMVKSIAEEIRGLAVETNTIIFSATQTNRSGFDDMEVDMDNVSESWGVPATADFMAALISTEELEAQKKMIIKVLKNRYNELGTNRKFPVGVDKSYMRLYNVGGQEEFERPKPKVKEEVAKRPMERISELVMFDDDAF